MLPTLLPLYPCICSFQEEELERLEREFAIQSQITEAARRLASDPHVSSKKLKKQRKTSYLNALKKLQEIENSINEYRIRSGKKPTQRASLIIEGTSSLKLLSHDSIFLHSGVFSNRIKSWQKNEQNSFKSPKNMMDLGQNLVQN